MALDLEALKAKVKVFQESKQDYDKDWPKVTFLPEGNHKVRFITDPVDEVMLDFYTFGYFNKGIRDPDDVPTVSEAYPNGKPVGFINELKQFYEEKFKPLQLWKYNAKRTILAYLYLYETDKPSDNWQPDNLYVIIGNGKFHESYTNFLSILAKDAPEEIIKTLNPLVKGVQLQLTVVSGSQGSCSIGATFPAKFVDPIAIDKFPYVSLQTAYIKPGFDQTKYDALLNMYKTEFNKLSGTTIPEGASGETLGAPVSTAASGQSMLGAPAADQPQANAAPVSTPAPVQQVATPAPTETPASTPAATATPAAAAVTADSPPFTPDPTPAPAANTNDVWGKFRSAQAAAATS